MNVRSEVLVRTSSTHSERLQERKTLVASSETYNLFSSMPRQHRMPSLTQTEGIQLAGTLPSNTKGVPPAGEPYLLTVMPSFEAGHKIKHGKLATSYQRMHQEVVNESPPTCYAQNACR